jgi:hypothetical protein
MVSGVRKSTQGLKAGTLCADFAVRLKSCIDAGEKQILRCAYPNFVGAPSCSAQDDTVGVSATCWCETRAPSCSAQDDTQISRAEKAWLKSCIDAEEKQILRYAYPNFVGAPSCSAQDDTS